jgi:hypothetical protein
MQQNTFAGPCIEPPPPKNVTVPSIVPENGLLHLLADVVVHDKRRADKESIIQVLAWEENVSAFPDGHGGWSRWPSCPSPTARMLPSVLLPSRLRGAAGGRCRQDLTLLPFKMGGGGQWGGMRHTRVFLVRVGIVKDSMMSRQGGGDGGKGGATETPGWCVQRWLRPIAMVSSRPGNGDACCNPILAMCDSVGGIMIIDFIRL